jgi:hypothetical protein
MQFSYAQNTHGAQMRKHYFIWFMGCQVKPNKVMFITEAQRSAKQTQGTET